MPSLCEWRDNKYERQMSSDIIESECCFYDIIFMMGNNITIDRTQIAIEVGEQKADKSLCEMRK